MSLHRTSLRMIFASLGGLAVAGLPFMTGCGSSEVGTNPSSRKQIVEGMTKEGAVDSQVGSGKRGKGGPVPQNIKKKLFTREAGKTE